VTQNDLLNVTKIVVWEKPNLRPIFRYYYCKVHCCDLQICLEVLSVLYKCMMWYCRHFRQGSFHGCVFGRLLQTYALPHIVPDMGNFKTWTFCMSHWYVNSSCSVATCLRFSVLLCSTLCCRT